MAPIRVSEVENDAVAVTLRDALHQHGIDAFLADAGARNGTQSAGVCEVWISSEDDLERALEIVDSGSREARERVSPNWRCGKCGETIEGQFSDCWRCGSSRSHGEELRRVRPKRRQRKRQVRHVHTGNVMLPETVLHGLARIRRWRLLNLVAVAAYLPLTAGLVVLLDHVAPDATGPMTIGSFVTTAGITLFRREMQCPRCGRSYFHSKSGRFGDLDTWSRCAHCELRIDGDNLR